MTQLPHTPHSTFSCWKIFRCLLALVIIYMVAEHWAQVRFFHSNPLMPSTMRKNLGLHPLDAFRLKPNFDGWSQKGLRYRTNELGFRVGETRKGQHKSSDHVILLGGDSRIFGYALEYSGTVSAQLEHESDIRVHQQAFPGSSPAIFNVQIWDEQLWDQLKPQPNLVIYGYDRDDIWNDLSFKPEYQNSQSFTWTSPRIIKLTLGGYLWNMANLKKKAFLARSSWTPPWWEAWEKKWDQPELVAVPAAQVEASIPAPPQASQRSNPICRESLLKMKRQCEQRGVPFLLMYLPRSLELLYDDSKMRDELKVFCQTEKFTLLDLYEVFSERCADNKELVATWFLDLEEGIHFSAHGSNIIAEAIDQHLRVTP